MTIPRPVAWFFLSLPWIAVGLLGAYLCVVHVPPSGIRTFEIPLDGKSPWFGTFLPGQRATEPGPQPGGWTGQRITAEPVYAGVRLPGAYDRLDVTLEARTAHQPILEMGILRDADAFSFENVPLWSSVLSHGWHAAEQDGIRGYVRDGVPDAMIASAGYDRTLVWFATTTSPLLMDSSAAEQTISVSLRGTHDLYSVPVNGRLSFQIAVQDMNRTRGKNTVIFRVTKNDDLVWTEALSVGGSLDEKPNRVSKQTVQLSDLTPGIYRLTVIADDDIFIRSIQTGARHWVIGPRLYVGDTVGYSTTTASAAVWTNSRHAVVETFHAEGRQTVSFGSSTISVDRTHEPYTLDRLTDEMSGARLLTVPKGDLRVIGDGYFSFTKDALFLPQQRRLTDASDPVQEGIVAIRTPYQIPTWTDDGWVRMHATFTLPANAYDAPKLSLGAPGLVSRNGSVDVLAVTVTFRRTAIHWDEWWVYLRRELAAAWHRL